MFQERPNPYTPPENQDSEAKSKAAEDQFIATMQEDDTEVTETVDKMVEEARRQNREVIEKFLANIGNPAQITREHLTDLEPAARKELRLAVENFAGNKELNPLAAQIKAWLKSIPLEK